MLADPVRPPPKPRRRAPTLPGHAGRLLNEVPAAAAFHLLAAFSVRVSAAGMASELLPADISIERGSGLVMRIELELSAMARKTAQAELRETEDVVPAALAEFRRLLEEEKDLHIPLDDEVFHKAFLRPCHWYPEAAMEKLKNYYRFKLRNPHLARDLLPSRMENLIRACLMDIFPRRDQFGRRILKLETGRKWDPKKVSMDEILRGVMLLLETALAEPDSQVAGAVIIWDLDGLSLSQVLKFTPSFARNLLHWVQDCVPIRVKAIHFINQSNLFDIAFNVLKGFLRDKLRNRLYFHKKDYAGLLKYIDAKALPVEYGGELQFSQIDPDDQVQLFQRVEKYFEEVGKYGYPPEKVIN